MEKVNIPCTWYTIEHRTSGGEWVDEGQSFDTYEDAVKELEYCPNQPTEKYRIVENHGTIIWRM